ncbi:MAG: 2Fe-2S iron-sulfur cluster binding domain-containing protein [Pararhodobacter sp.]|nr:2Fe-2S iron-sulfur cluster binding domain-containing protein [Pararhodobacter sp.]
MPCLTFVCPDGRAIPVSAQSGMSAMEAARGANVPGIIAECGGACSCATCHVLVDPEWASAVGSPNEIERDMLEFAENPCENSRLCCQITLNDTLDGLVLHLPG